VGMAEAILGMYLFESNNPDVHRSIIADAHWEWLLIYSLKLFIFSQI
jgi:hypothetical protein